MCKYVWPAVFGNIMWIDVKKKQTTENVYSLNRFLTRHKFKDIGNYPTQKYKMILLLLFGTTATKKIFKLWLKFKIFPFVTVSHYYSHENCDVLFFIIFWLAYRFDMIWCRESHIWKIESYNKIKDPPRTQ